MSQIKFIMLFLLPVFKPAFADLGLACKADKFNLPGVTVSVKHFQPLKKTSVSFANKNNFWHVSAYEFDKYEPLYLLAGIGKLNGHKGITSKILTNYKNRLEQELLYKTEVIQTFPVSISGHQGTGYMLNAVYSDPATTSESSKITNSTERFALWAIVYNEKIFYGELHVSVNSELPSISVTIERISNFIATCSLSPSKPPKKSKQEYSIS